MTKLTVAAHCRTFVPTTLRAYFSQQLRWRRSNVIDYIGETETAGTSLYEFLEPKYFGDGLAMALPRNDPQIKSLINDALKKVRQSGRFQEIVERYFPEGRALGFTVELAGVNGVTDPRQIVGVVANTRAEAEDVRAFGPRRIVLQFPAIFVVVR